MSVGFAATMVAFAGESSTGTSRALAVPDPDTPTATPATFELLVYHRHEIIGHPTLADAILDRLIHNACRIILRGEFMRKRHANLTPTNAST